MTLCITWHDAMFFNTNFKAQELDEKKSLKLADPSQFFQTSKISKDLKRAQNKQKGLDFPSSWLVTSEAFWHIQNYFSTPDSHAKKNIINTKTGDFFCKYPLVSDYGDRHVNFMLFWVCPIN